MAFGEPVVGTGGDKLITCMLLELHLSETNGSSGTQTWTTRLTDGDAKHYAVSPPSLCMYRIDVFEM